MSGVQLRQARKARGWTQSDLAQRVCVSQGYVSLLEHGARRVPRRLANKFVSALGLPPSALPLSLKAEPLAADRLTAALASLGYPGFAYMRWKKKFNPAELVVRALRCKTLDARVVEALPWLLVKYPDLDWDWLLRETKLHDLQNRLGFVVTVARELAARTGDPAGAKKLAEVERELTNSRLQKEDAFASDTLTEAERRWLRSHRPPEAAYWNVLTNMTAETLADVTRPVT